MTTPPPPPPRRAGRIPAAERARRREQVLEAALDELIEVGFERATMSGIATRAGASKETLYAWFGDKTGLFTAVIENNADRAVSVPAAAEMRSAPSQEEIRRTLVSFAEGLLHLLTGAESVAVNRAAMSSPELAATLRSAGRGRTGPAVEQYFARLHELGALNVPDPDDAFRLLYGLTVQDTQIAALLGASQIPATQRRARAVRAVDRFLVLVTPADADGRAG